MTKPRARDTRSFAERFEQMDSQVPMTDEEAKEVLAQSGLDPSASLKRLLDDLDGLEATERHERFARAEVARQRELSRLGKGFEHLGHKDLLEQLCAYQVKYPELRANFRGLQGAASDDELRTLLAEIEELVRRASEK
jgi:hypothetical protein